MTPAEVIQDCRRAGLVLRVVDGGIGVSPRDRLTPDLVEAIKAHKAGLVFELGAAEAVAEHLEERAAIQEYDGGLPRADAERSARRNLRVFKYRLTDDPAAELVFISPGSTLDQATARLRHQFGPERLLEVRTHDTGEAAA